MCKDAFETQRQDFLFYCLFGITKTEADCEIDKHKLAFYACIDRAYRDLSRTLEYRIPISKLERMKKKDKERISFEELKERFKGKIKGIFKEYIFDDKKELKHKISSNRKEFDKWHEALCGEIVRTSKNTVAEDGKRLFEKDDGSISYVSYGQAQKWVNMTLKYMLIMGYWSEIIDVKDALHIPIDDYIYKAANSPKDQPIHENMAVHGLGVEWIKKNKEKVAWSNIDNYNVYLKYQNSIKESIDKNYYQSPIEWEFDAWIAQAKKENKNK